MSAGGPTSGGRDPRSYRARSYREGMGGRFRSFTAAYKESDLWLGVDPASYSGRMEDFAASEARKLRLELEAYIARRPEFLASLIPIPDDPGAPLLARAMLAAALSAGVGPMAAVAGAVAEAVGRAVRAEFGCREVLVENGGDLWLAFEGGIDVAVFAGDSPLSERVGVSIPASLSPLGLCTSSGTVGASLSLGRADAAMVASTDAATADAWATRIGNAVRSPESIEAALNLFDGRALELYDGLPLGLAEGKPRLVSVLVVAGERMGLRGELPLKLFG
jgi:uncharacterized protein